MSKAVAKTIAQMKRQLAILVAKHEDQILLADQAERIAKIDALIAHVHATPEAKPEVMSGPKPVVIRKNKKGYRVFPKFSQWKDWLALRTNAQPKRGKANGYQASGLLPIGESDIKTLCISCGIPIDLANSGKSRRIKDATIGYIAVGCLVEKDFTEGVEESLMCGQCDNPAVGYVWKQPVCWRHKHQILPVYQKGPGCIGCQMAYLKVQAECKRVNESEGTSNIPYIEIDPLDVEPTGVVAVYHSGVIA